MMEKFSWIVLTSPSPGQEDEYNRWYSDQHIPDVLRVPGVVAAQRFVLADTQMIRTSVDSAPEIGHRDQSDAPAQYAAIYEIEAANPAEVFAEVMSRIGTDQMPSSPAMSGQMASWCFRSITERKTAP